MDYIVLAIPVFFILIGLELLISRLQGTRLYRFNDAISNISCGITQQITGVLAKTALIIAYLYLYDHWRLFEIEDNILTWIVLFIGIDFFYYWFHRMAHEVSLFWGTHIVHHQSEEYNLSVALRQSSLQGFISMIFYLPLAILGFNPVGFVTISAFQTLYQFWIHTRVIGKMHPWIEFVFNTPSHHRVHHGRNPKYIDKNHGGTLIIWDRMFGTFQEEEEEVVYGVTKPLASWNPVWANLDWYADMWSDLRRPMSWGDRFRLLFEKPGWLPDHLGGYRAPQEIIPGKAAIYDTEIPLGLNYYILFQYLVVLAGTTGFLFNTDLFTTWQLWGIATLIVISVMNIGGLFEGRMWALVLEMARFTFILVMVIVLWNLSVISTAVLFSVAIISFLSQLWIWRYRTLFGRGI